MYPSKLPYEISCLWDVTTTETTATSLRAISSNSFSWFSCLSNEGLGVSNVKKRFGSVNNLWGNVHPPNAIFQHSDGCHFRRTAGGYDVFFRSPPIHEAHSSPEWLGCSQGPAIWKDSPPNSAASFIAANKMSQKKWMCLPCIGFSSSICSTFRCMSVCFFLQFFPQGKRTSTSMLGCPSLTGTPWNGSE